MMSDVVEQQEESVNELDVLRTQLDEARKAIEALASKKEELLKETKQAKEERRRAAETAEQAKREQQSIAEKNGEYEKLYKQKDEEYTKLRQELTKAQTERRDEKIELAANKIANELTKGDGNKAELLSAFIAKTISTVADENGRVDNDTLLDVKKQFENNAKYAPLIVTNLSTGGGATGNMRSAQNDSKDLSKLSPVDRINAMRAGNK